MNIAQRLAHAQRTMDEHIQAREFHRQQSEAHNAEGLRWEGRVQELQEIAAEDAAAPPNVTRMPTSGEAAD